MLASGHGDFVVTNLYLGWNGAGAEQGGAGIYNPDLDVFMRPHLVLPPGRALLN